MKQQFSFEITNPDTHWRVKIRRRSRARPPDSVVIALHWGDKAAPTHEFEVSAADFARMAGLLIPEMNHAPK